MKNSLCLVTNAIVTIKKNSIQYLHALKIFVIKQNKWAAAAQYQLYN